MAEANVLTNQTLSKGAFRRQQRQETATANSQSTARQATTQDPQAMSARQYLRQGRRIRAKELRDNQAKSRLRKNANALADVAGEVATAHLLKLSWINLIDSFGLTLLYINFHFAARYFAGSRRFCQFGIEWFTFGKVGVAKKAKGRARQQATRNSQGKVAASGSRIAGAASSAVIKAKNLAKVMASKPIELAEIIVLVVLDIIIATLLLISFLTLMLPILAPIVGWTFLASYF